MGVSTERAPTPRPATHRPREIWYHVLVVVIWTITPTQKMMFQKTMEYLRPNLSATGAAIKAPIKVPIDSYEICQFMIDIIAEDNLTYQRYDQSGLPVAERGPACFWIC